MPSSPLQVVFVDPAALSGHQAVVESLIAETFERASGALPLGSVSVTVSTDAARVVPGWGLGGYTLGPNEIEIVIDPLFPSLAEVLPQRLPHIAAHEFHHAVRWRDPGPYQTLLEALVFEGMADHFALELVPGPLPPWSKAFREGQTAHYLARARPEFDNADFDFNAWFFGLGTDLPPWTGYTLGFRLVRDYLASHPGSTAAQLVSTPAEAFRPD